MGYAKHRHGEEGTYLSCCVERTDGDISCVVRLNDSLFCNIRNRWHRLTSNHFDYRRLISKSDFDKRLYRSFGASKFHWPVFDPGVASVGQQDYVSGV